MTVEEIDKLLEFLGKLSSDDEFRSEFERDPVEVLARFGVEVPADTKVTVPPKEALVEALSSLARGMTYPPTGYRPPAGQGPAGLYWPWGWPWGPWGPSPWGPWGPWGGPPGPWGWPLWTNR